MIELMRFFENFDSIKYYHNPYKYMKFCNKGYIINGFRNGYLGLYDLKQYYI